MAALIIFAGVTYIIVKLVQEASQPTRNCGTDFNKFWKETEGMTPSQKNRALNSGRYDVPLGKK